MKCHWTFSQLGSWCNHHSNATSVCFMIYYLLIIDPKPLPLYSLIHLKESSVRKPASSHWSWRQWSLTQAKSASRPCVGTNKSLSKELDWKDKVGSSVPFCSQAPHSLHVAEVTVGRSVPRWPRTWLPACVWGRRRFEMLPLVIDQRGGVLLLPSHRFLSLENTHQLIEQLTLVIIATKGRKRDFNQISYI